MAETRRHDRFRKFLHGFAALIDENPAEDIILDQGSRLLGELVSTDDWLEPQFATADPARYQQFLLYADARERFSVVSFVWGPNQFTPIHNHTVWGLIGVLRGAETSQPFKHDASGRLVADGSPTYLAPGAVEAVSPRIGDIHQVRNALADRASISIHVYGANIGGVRRSVFKEDGSEKLFISGYSNSVLPNPWDLSKEQSDQ
jgi:predicted metal-dependent enzyme (double-stranded beta helix superfamily)